MSAKAFVDTNILVYAHDITGGRKRTIAQTLLEGLWLEGTGSLSIQVLQEFYVTLTRKLEADAVAPRAARALISTYARWSTHRPGAPDVLAAIDLHQRQQLSFWDAMIVTSAASLGCTQLFTEDLNHGQTISGVQITDPFRTIP